MHKRFSLFGNSLGSEINPMSMVEANRKAFITSLEKKSNFSSSIDYWNRSSGTDYGHRHSNDQQVIENMFSVGGKLLFYWVENLVSGFGVEQFRLLFYSIGMSKDNSRKLEYQFSSGWIIYTKGAIFGVSESHTFNSFLMSLESYPRGNQIKSNKFIIEHPRELVGRWGPILI
jgi:hypothetical protein